MNLIMRTFLVLLMVNGKDLSCAEHGGWKGLKVKPDPHNSEYPVNEDEDCWNVQNIPSETRTTVCESLRQKYKGAGWTLRMDESARCTVYSVIMFEMDTNYTIRGSECKFTVSGKNQSVSSSSTALQPSFHSADSQSQLKSPLNQTTHESNGSRSSKNIMMASSEKANLNTSLIRTESPTKSPSIKLARGHYFYELIVTAVILVLLVLCCCFRIVYMAIKQKGSRKYHCICFSRHLHAKPINEELRQVSGQSSNTTLSRYLNPFSKKLTQRSEQECFLIDKSKSSFDSSTV